MSIVKGSVVDGKVKSITNFGAFVELSSGQIGLVHISEIANEYVNDIRKYLKEDQYVKVKVLEIRDDGKKISLSIKRAAEKMEANRPRYINRKERANDFESKLNKFLRESDEKLSEYKKRYEGKRR